MNEPNTNIEELPLEILKLTADIKQASQKMTANQARLLIGNYYTMQRYRVKSQLQVHSCEKQDEPHDSIEYFREQMERCENQVVIMLKYFAQEDPMANWSMNVKGIGPVLAAALSAFIDITKAPTVGHIWRFAGLDPTLKWAAKTKRPFCAMLKTICWKISEQWVKLKNDPEAFYARILFERKALEWERNLKGMFADQCAAALKAKRWDDDGNARAWYSGLVDVKWAGEIIESGESFPLAIKKVKEPGIQMLPPAHIHARAKRYAVKLFLSHWHGEAYRQHYKTEPPKPYPIAQLGHAHMIESPV